MKLAISNIAWPLAAEGEALELFQRAGVTGIEVAPTRLWPDWQGASAPAAQAYSKILAAQGFSVPALQAILFAKPQLQLFGIKASRQQLSDHLRSVADLASALGATSLVFGAPKNRLLNDLTPEIGFAIARDFFSSLAPYYEECGVCLCLEANPPQYACTFVTNSSEAARLVRAVDSPGFGLHLDTACMSLAGEDFSTAIGNNLDILRHFHVSEPFLNPFATPQIDHAQVAAILRGARYSGWVSLEMRETAQPAHDVAQAAGFLAHTYGGES